ncbi:hypothetical protein EXW39_29415 (plasmid) [Bacillus mycoides]|uniref:hypothetical protein n=1 Tax=Bacillus mycoides TaxID=1405 RepID=UPI001C021165|nr:hypothetical protein [Bacillus mycoides]QWH64189.1 hypothetical protein EXW39_29415 [Bacillus mycoides]
MVSIEEMQDSYKKLESAILFYQSHANGPNRLLIEELYTRLNQQLQRILGQGVQRNSVKSPENLSSLPKGISVHTEEGEHTYYVFDHEILGRIGKIFVLSKGVNKLYVEAELSKEDKGNIVKDILGVLS